jgi:predicted ATP-grasp superfamily ATP-dependent carboligase
MGTVVITDGKYRTAIAAARALGRAGYEVVVTQTRKDSALEPPVFASCFVSKGRWIEGAAADPQYADRLLELLREYDHPVLFCVGAVSLNTVSRERERFREVCDFLIAPPEVLDQLNDKETVHARCEELGIPVPRQYSGQPDGFPVVVKPHCGEKFGLKARDRYAVAHNQAEYEAALAAMQAYDPAPIVQQKIEGPGGGVSLLLDQDSRLICAVCHRRIREYPASGGPSTCCESFYDEGMIRSAYRLLESFHFVGMAMVEFKGNCVLEVNPRVWGSFPMTEHTKSPFVCRYAQAAAGAVLEYVPRDYQTGVRMRFLLNDTVAMLDYLRHGRPGPFFQGIADTFRAKEALSCREDPGPMRRYLRNNLLRR